MGKIIIDSGNNCATVRFNVGGTNYQVSRSLLEQYPNTMLFRMVSDTWLDVTNIYDGAEKEPIFIDRDGERFRYILDYMRDGQQVNLPEYVSKGGLVKDIEYFGFENVDTNTIKQPPSVSMYAKSRKEMETKEANLSTLLECSTLVHYCFLRWRFSGELVIPIGCDHKVGEFSNEKHQIYETPGKKKELAQIAESVRCEAHKREFFNECLKDLGLKFINIGVGHTSKCLIVTLNYFDVP